MVKRVSIKEIIEGYKETEGNITQASNLLGISRHTVKRWVKRGTSLYGNVTFRGIHRKSTKPHKTHFKLSLDQQKEIIDLKQMEHLGAKKLKHILSINASYITIHRLLKKKNLVTIQPNFRRPLFQNGYAMRPNNTKELGYLQIDTKHVTPELSGLPFTVYEYAAIDILSRYKLAVLLPDISDESASLALEFFLKWFPFKVVYIQTDNGLEHQRSFEDTCKKHNINHYYIHKNSPNENAVIERSFRTDEDEFYFWLEKQPQHIGELNEWLQKFINKYNTWRPHQALDYRTPIEIVNLYQMS